MARPATPYQSSVGSRALNPVDFGVDPTCTTDASPAFVALLVALTNMTVGNMSDGIKDLGGATVDLAGG